ncbi:MAG: ADP-ribosylation factor-like protein [Candidatus Odinarchaeota archaeon]
MKDQVTGEPEKIILIGLAESGKTTIIRVITEGYVPDRKAEYTATLDYERKKITLMGKRLTLFDLGGQKAFLDRFTGELAQFMFSKVKVMIFVVDIMDVNALSRARYYLDLALNNINHYSPTALIYVFLHKTDLITMDNIEDSSKNKLDNFTKNVKTYLTAELSDPNQITGFFETTVFTESIFNAFGSIFADITKSYKPLKKVLDSFIKENSRTVKRIQIFSESGVPLLEFSDSSNFSMNQTRTMLDTTVKGLAGNFEKAISTLIESEENIYFIRVLAHRFTLYLQFSREAAQENNESIPSLYSKVLVLSKKLDSLYS